MALGLVHHESVSVRLTALSSLIHTPAPSQAITGKVLSVLQEGLLYFHVETDARARNVYISVMKKLFLRMPGILLQLRRLSDTNRISPKPTRSSELSASVVPPTHSDPGLESHLRFTNAYIATLIDDLNPSVSYQCHITSLKILWNIISSGLVNLFKVNLSQLHLLDDIADGFRQGYSITPSSDSCGIYS